MITWTENMTTGVAKLDKQHQKLIEKYNELDEAISNHTGREVIGEVLDFLQFYALWHFGEEEACMAQYQCPVARANQLAHAEFVDLFGGLHEKWQSNTLDLPKCAVKPLALDMGI
ncbi:MAG: hemerythrin [Chloroflexi bacterium]|nr:hemerythrin [Chloroflexota bacterium]